MASTIAAIERKRLIAESPTADISAALHKELREYLAASHLDISQFARYINYAVPTVHSWLHGTYHNIGASDRHLVKAVRAFIDSNPIAPTPENQGRFYDTENVATMQRWFDHCLGINYGRGRMVCIYSGPGGQKTFISENLIARFNRDNLNNPERPRALYVYCSQDITPVQLVAKILGAAGVASAGMMQKNLASLRFSFRRRRVVLLFDEAQHLSISCLEIIRELNDLGPYFGVMLLGSHKLRMTFEQRAAEMEQWNSRLTAAVELPGIGEEWARKIITSELEGVTALSERKIATLLKACEADDIYSREKKKYRSARRLFRSIEQIKEAAAQPTPGGVQ
jgi:DNA transposition AAA+ family ATPase